MLQPSRCLSQKTFLWNQNPLGIMDQLPSFRICKQNLQKKKCKTNKCIRFFYICTKIPLDKLLDILYRIVDFVFKGGTKDYIITNKFVDHGHLRKEGITSLTNFFYITDFSLLEI